LNGKRKKIFLEVIFFVCNEYIGHQFLREKVISILNENLCSLKKPVHECLLAVQFLITKSANNPNAHQ